MHISSLRTRKSTMPETADKLESLRQKQEKVQLQEREFKLEYERKMDELQFKKQELDKREVCPATLRSLLPVYGNGTVKFRAN